MAFIAKKKTKYSTYYVVIENKRIDGQSRVVKQWYLGTIERIIEMAEGKSAGTVPACIDTRNHGAVAVLKSISDELGIRNIVDSHSSKRRQGMSTGDYILLSSMNRAIAATSKSKLGEWVNGTTLPLEMKIDPAKLSSQHLWNHFDRLTEKKVEQIGDEIARRAVEVEKIPLDCLVYDTTNYFNYWDVLNPSELARHTKSKAGKNSLRHIGLALAVERDHGIPLFHRLYPANRHDSFVFRETMDAMFHQISSMVSDKKGLTLVFDKGNNSEESILKLDESRHHFVGTRSTWHHKDLCRIPLENFREMEIPSDKGNYRLPVYETTQEIYGKPRRLLVVYNESTYRRQLYRMERNINRAKEDLSFFKKKAKNADGRSTVESIMKQATEVTDRYHVSGLLSIDVEEARDGYNVSARQNFPAIEDAKTRMGKQILFTSRESLEAGEIIKYYLDRYIVEDAFRITKSDNWVKWDPAFHWTDSKIRVHALTCFIALLLVKIAHKRARQGGFKPGTERMMELLSSVRSSLLYFPKTRKPVRMICDISDEQKQLLTTFGIPFSNSM